MRLTSDDGSAVELRPLRYQFGPSSESRDWDANWLVVTGQVDFPDGRSWSFTDPCLTTWEARALGSWLRAVANGGVVPTAFDDEDDISLVFTEPDVALSLASRNAEVAVVRVHLSHEARPPWLSDADGPGLFALFVELRLTADALAAAASSWDAELAAFPVR